MKFKVLESGGKDYDEWLYLVNELKPEHRDIHFLPEYGRLYKKTYGYEPCLAYYGNEHQYMIQPFIKRQLNDLPFLKEQNITKPYYDIANAYGYGGPVGLFDSTEQASRLYQEFNLKFVDYCKQEQFASEFTSLHPLLKNHELINSELINITLQKEIVYFDLSLSEKELWQGVNRGHKSSINKARKNGVSVKKVNATSSNLTKFNAMYYETMMRNKAAKRWFFPKDYFFNCFEFLGPKRLSLFIAYVEDKIASAYLLMHDFTIVYYHFGASDSKYYNLRPNNLLMYEIALWAKKQGFSRFHLGGGVTDFADDPLFRFKSGFSDKRAKLYSYSRIIHRETYDYLCILKQRYELQANGSVIKSNYFPQYRRELAG